MPFLVSLVFSRNVLLYCVHLQLCCVSNYKVSTTFGLGFKSQKGIMQENVIIFLTTLHHHYIIPSCALCLKDDDIYSMVDLSKESVLYTPKLGQLVTKP